VVVVSDSPYGRADVAMATNFEAVYNALETLLGASLESARASLDDARVTAYLFQDKQQYERFATYADPRAAERSAGMYFSGFGILAFYLEAYSQPYVRHVMLHECTHAFLDQRIRLTRRPVPDWLQEGLAEYVGLSNVTEGEIRIGVFTAKTRHDSFEGLLITRSEASEQLSRARHAVRHKLTLDRILSTDPMRVADKDDLSEYYATCWLFVSWLRDGRDGWATHQFPTLVREIGAGHSDRETLEMVYGISVKEMEPAVIQHIKDFKLVHGWTVSED